MIIKDEHFYKTLAADYNDTLGESLLKELEQPDHPDFDSFAESRLDAKMAVLLAQEKLRIKTRKTYRTWVAAAASILMIVFSATMFFTNIGRVADDYVSDSMPITAAGEVTAMPAAADAAIPHIYVMEDADEATDFAAGGAWGLSPEGEYALEQWQRQMRQSGGEHHRGGGSLGTDIGQGIAAVPPPPPGLNLHNAPVDTADDEVLADIAAAPAEAHYFGLESRSRRALAAPEGWQIIDMYESLQLEHDDGSIVYLSVAELVDLDGMFVYAFYIEGVLYTLRTENENVNLEELASYFKD